MSDATHRPPRKPFWLRKRHSFKHTTAIKSGLREKRLNTVCESARCPNIGDCFKRGTATFLILGNACNRSCGFCDVEAGRVASPDEREPENVARMVAELRLRHAVVTSVTRDDLSDGGAGHFVKTLRAIRRVTPGVTVELLIPDFNGNLPALEKVLDAEPDVLAHNVEMTPSLYPRVRPQADYRRSLDILRHTARCNVTAKSGIMVGLGETGKELLQVIRDLKECNVDILTIGQYLQPSRTRARVERYYPEQWFQGIAAVARDIGIPRVVSGPYVRSSYMADRANRS